MTFEKTFEKKFPSLVGKKLTQLKKWNAHNDEIDIFDMTDYDECFTRFAIERNCVDKQRVRDELLKLFPPNDVMYGSNVILDALKRIEYELDL